ncbi:MAG: hypothetical protein ACD_25C00271G0001 [uncultured bacterium]|nr:MAG: hypothetical protein ACD_25C00271G0001 [uncultured bacterium]
MKKLIVLSSFMMFAFYMIFPANIFAQNTTQSSKAMESYIYCEIIGIEKLMSNKVTVRIDFGQNTKFAEDTRLRDESGNVIVFNSMVDAMNWMGGQGWEFVQAYVVSVAQGSNVFHWLLKLNTKLLSPEELDQVKGMFKTKRTFGI